MIEKWLGKETKGDRLFSGALAVWLVTLPVVLYHFYQLPLYGMFLNLLVLPLMGGVLCSGIGIIFLGNVPLIQIFAAGIGHYILAFYEVLCKLTLGFPGGSLVFGRPGVSRILVYCGVVAGVLLGMKRWGEKKKIFPARSFRWLFLAAFYIGSILFFIPAPVRGLEALFLDVGQGDGILLRTGRRGILIDGGSSSKKSLGEYTLEPCLKSLGISRLEYVFVSHGHEDHISGIAWLLEFCTDIRVENLVLPYHGKKEDGVKGLEELAQKRGTRVRYMAAGEEISLEKLKFTCLFPGTEDVPENENQESLVLKMDYGSCHVLFTGDMEEAGEEILVNRSANRKLLAEVNVLKTPHHGSKYSSMEVFLDTISPKWAVISYGEGNSYGHPHEEVLSRLKERGIAVFETAKAGAVRMWTDGEKMRIFGFAE